MNANERRKRNDDARTAWLEGRTVTLEIGSQRWLIQLSNGWTTHGRKSLNDWHVTTSVPPGVPRPSITEPGRIWPLGWFVGVREPKELPDGSCRFRLVLCICETDWVKIGM